MAFVNWKEEFSVRVPEIDMQHRRLLDIINKLHEAMHMGGKPEALKTVSDELVSYTRYHFGYEEQMLARAGYRGLEEHKRKHRAMVAQVEGFAAEITSGKASVSIKLMAFLKDWLSRHIMETDQQYATYLAGRAA
ncbi:MAG: hemerythrin family protein [Bryobacterales bacterium]|nr:hemerythrin family protein [Bryobacterales bacterium]